MINLKHSILPHAVTFSFENKDKRIPVNQWDNYENLGCSLLLGWTQSEPEHTEVREDEIMISMRKISSINDDIAIDLGLPRQESIVMHIQHEGNISDKNFSFKYEWYKDGKNRPIINVRRLGCFLLISDKYVRLPLQLFQIAEGIDKISNTLGDDIKDRLLAWSTIENYLPQDTKHSITVDGFLNSTKVYSANAFELAIDQNGENINFYPILLSQKQNQPSDFFDDRIEFEKLLTPDDQQKFSVQFTKYPECCETYTLSSGKYIILSKELKKALVIVRKMQNAPLQKRIEFLKNPQAIIAMEDFPEGMLERVFSDRIEGYGERKVKIIPWIKIEGQDWFPNENSPRGLLIGDDEIISIASTEEANSLITDIRQAILDGSSEIIFKNKKIPATTEALSRIVDIFPIKPEKKSQSVNEPSIESPKKYVLYVKDNFSDIRYQPTFKPRLGLTPFISAPKILKTALKPHQYDGVKWLVNNYSAGIGGVLLADDMGLGKTFQALSFLTWLRENIEQGRVSKHPILIVAPTGLLENWKEEHDRHLHNPGLGELLPAYGSNLKKIHDPSNKNQLIKSLKMQKLRDADWILTTYETLNNYQASFAAIKYSAIIFDEIQKIKTPNTRITEAAQTMNADLIIGMTGTPIENRLSDLWCLVDTLQPSRLGTLKHFSEKFEKKVSTETLEQLKKDLTETVDNNPPFMLRRMKDTTLKLEGLPKIIEKDEEIIMPDAQAKAYTRILKEARELGNKGSYFETLHKLRAVCLHPYTYKAGMNDESFIAASARLIATFRILDEIYKKQEKVIIFIEYREWLQADCLPGILKRRYKLSSRPMIISGKVKGTERQKYVNIFQEETGKFDVILLSPRAGGVGLTLTKANHVIHLSRWWNPAVEDQCTGRAYRLGQTRDVHVYYPIAKHPELGDKSFDYSLKNLLENKRTLSRTLLIPPISNGDIEQLANSIILAEPNENKINLNYSLDEINCMEEIQFEDWVANECKQSNLIIRKTQRTWDGGADVIIESVSGEIIAIIQCKHTQQKKVSNKIIDDLLKAEENYNAKNSKLIAVTNGKFNLQTIFNAKKIKNITLISSKDILNLKQIIRSLLLKI